MASHRASIQRVSISDCEAFCKTEGLIHKLLWLSRCLGHSFQLAHLIKPRVNSQALWQRLDNKLGTSFELQEGVLPHQHFQQHRDYWFSRCCCWPLMPFGEFVTVSWDSLRCELRKQVDTPLLHRQQVSTTGLSCLMAWCNQNFHHFSIFGGIRNLCRRLPE